MEYARLPGARVVQTVSARARTATQPRRILIACQQCRAHGGTEAIGARLKANGRKKTPLTSILDRYLFRAVHNQYSDGRRLFCEPESQLLLDSEPKGRDGGFRSAGLRFIGGKL